MEANRTVQVYVYDVTKGMAKAMSMMLLGKQIEGVWHTGIVVFGQEWFFGSVGIESCAPGETILGQPDSVVDLGQTEIPYEMFMDYLRELSKTSFRGENYHLLHHNCNNFSSELAVLLTGKDIPAAITNLPDEVLSTPFGQMIKPILDSMSVNPGGGAHAVFSGRSTTSEPSANRSLTSTGRPHPVKPHGPTSALFSQAKFFPSQPVLLDDCLSCCDDKDLVKDLAEYAFSSSCSWSIGPLHLKCLDDLLRRTQECHGEELSSRVNPSAAERQSALWMMYQGILIKPEAAELISRLKDSTYFHLLMNAEDMHCKLESLKSLCNLCSTHAGYQCSVSRTKWPQGEFTNHDALETYCKLLHSEDSDCVHAATILALYISKYHNPSDDLDALIVSGLVERLSVGRCEDRTVPFALYALKSFMSKSRDMILLTRATGLNLDQYLNSSASTEIIDMCNEILKLQAEAN